MATNEEKKTQTVDEAFSKTPIVVGLKNNPYYLVLCTHGELFLSIKTPEIDIGSSVRVVGFFVDNTPNPDYSVDISKNNLFHTLTLQNASDLVSSKTKDDFIEIVIPQGSIKFIKNLIYKKK